MIPDPLLVSPRPSRGVRRTVSFALNDDEGDTTYPTVVVVPYTTDEASNSDDMLCDELVAEEEEDHTSTEFTPLLVFDSVLASGCCVIM